MTQISEKSEAQHADQAGSHDGTEPEVLTLENEAKRLAAGFNELSLWAEFHVWRVRRMANRQDKKYQARERIRQARANRDRQGRGKYIFVISVPTIAKIIKHIKSLRTRSSRVGIGFEKEGKFFNQAKRRIERELKESLDEET